MNFFIAGFWIYIYKFCELNRIVNLVSKITHLIPCKGRVMKIKLQRVSIYCNAPFLLLPQTGQGIIRVNGLWCE